MARVLSIHRGRVEPVGEGGKISAIRKTPVAGPVRILDTGVEGDKVVDLRYHGGPFKALCTCASEYYGDWAALAGREMPPGSFGENLFLEGLCDEDVCVGDVYTMGPVTFQVAGPRGPCRTLSTHWGNKDFALEVKRRRRTGWYARVLAQGAVEAPASIARVSQAAPGWTLPKFWDLMDGADAPPAEIAFLANADWLDPDWRRPLEKRLARG